MIAPNPYLSPQEPAPPPLNWPLLLFYAFSMLLLSCGQIVAAIWFAITEESFALWLLATLFLTSRFVYKTMTQERFRK